MKKKKKKKIFLINLVNLKETRNLLPWYTQLLMRTLHENK
jgi:hypothetical protein